MKHTDTPQPSGSNPPSSRHSFIETFQQTSGIAFNDAALLETALTHRSYINETHTPNDDNERLEFLGDSVLGLCIAHILFDAFGGSREGDLARMKSALVSEASLAQIASRLEIGAILRLGRGEEMSGGREKPAILADALEALLGAYYLDAGMEAVSSLIRRLFSEKLRELSTSSGKDFKSIMQEYAQKRGYGLPLYAVAKAEGPEHARRFYVSCTIDGITVGPLTGHTKKEAEQRAAEQAFARFHLKSDEEAAFLDSIAGIL